MPFCLKGHFMEMPPESLYCLSFVVLLFFNGLNNALLLILQMGPHDLFGRLTVMVKYGVEKIFVFCDQYRMLFDIPDIFHAVAVKLFPQIIDNGNQLIVAGGLEDGVVKLFVFFHDIEDIAALHGVHKLLMRFF